MPEQRPSASHDRTCTGDSVLTFDSNLLTPPLSLTDDERPPFKPDDLDNVSLSMKKPWTGGKHRRRLNRACASSGDMNDEQRSQVKRHSNQSTANKFSLLANLMTPTATLIKSPDEPSTVAPAMIVLRRATTKK